MAKQVDTKLAEQVKKAGLVDERGLMFLAMSYRCNKEGKMGELAERVFAVNGDNLSAAFVKKGVFGQKLEPYYLLEIENVSKVAGSKIDGNFYKIKFDYGAELAFNMVQDGGIEPAKKLLEAIGLKA